MSWMKPPPPPEHDAGVVVRQTSTQPEDDNLFLVGDIVTLASGGPPLTVLDVCDCGVCGVSWFSDDGLQFADFPEEALVLADLE